AIIANGGSAGSSVNIINSTFKGNDSGSTGSGGALNAQGATVITLSGTNNFEGNTAANGGAINNYYNGSKIIFAEGSTTNFINNTATSGNGGAINNVIHAAAEDAVVEIHGDVNFSGNTANGVANDIYNEHTLKILGGTTTTEGGIISKGEKSSVELSDATLALTGGKTSLDTLTGTNGTIKFVKPEAELAVASNSSTGLGVAASGEVNDAVNGDVSKLLQNVALNGDTALFMEAGDIVGEVSATLKTDEQGNLVIANKKEATNMDNKAIGEAGVALKAQWRAQMNDMNKRLGDLRNANGEQGVWTRMVRGEAEYQSVKAQYNQYQLGYDHKVGDQGWVLGAAVTYSEGDSTFYKGSTDDKSTAFAIYGSKLNDDGSFVDLIARYAHLKSDVTVTDDKADYSTDGYSVSAEYGKRFHDKAGFWVEPQVELTYGNMDGADYTIDGRAVHNGSMDSFIGRLGFSMGKDIKQGNIYARASYLYDFDGDTQTTFSKDGVSRTIKEDLGGGWWEVGVGTNINLSKATYVYADVEKTFGGEVDTNWQWNLGVRYSF
ncbi:MAG: autotransporter outer membrane beta-barrel domain-containing protein, partial [Phascolarctobacterium sp.]|nr:autotransporter outer membrane beta-barrel domain-containing protein [Phascolarctobacterium sp.]